MRVGGQIEWDAGDGDAEVGAVVEVHAAQVVLVGLAAAAVLADDDAGDGLEQLAGAQQRPPREVLAADDSLAGAVGDADELGGAAGDLDLFLDRRRGLRRLLVARRGLGLGSASARQREQRGQEDESARRAGASHDEPLRPPVRHGGGGG